MYSVCKSGVIRKMDELRERERERDRDREGIHAVLYSKRTPQDILSSIILIIPKKKKEKKLSFFWLEYENENEGGIDFLQCVGAKSQRRGERKKNRTY